MDAWQAHETEAARYRDKDESTQKLKRLDPEFETETAGLKADRRRLWQALNISGDECTAAKFVFLATQLIVVPLRLHSHVFEMGCCNPLSGAGMDYKAHKFTPPN